MKRGYMLFIVLATVVVLTTTACVPRPQDSPMPFVSPDPVENTVKITLYFANEDGSGLVQERRDVLRKNESLEALVLRELIRGPGVPGGGRTIPSEAKVISVQVVDRVAYANFTKELATRHSGGSTGEHMTISSVVYSLTELPGIDRVQFLLEGEKKESIFGHGITNEPIGREVLQPHQAGVARFVDDALVWRGRSQVLAGPVMAVGTGNVTGSKKDIIAAAGGEIYLFADTAEGYEIVWRMVFDRYVTGIAAADLNGDGHDEIIVVGASSGNWNPNVPGFITVFSWRDGTLVKLTDLSKDTMPFWSVATLDISRNGRPEVLASNGNALYVFSWLSEVGLEQLHLLSRFAGTIGSYSGLLAWRDANGVSLGLFEWSEEKWHTWWRIDGHGEWTSGTPGVGALSDSPEPITIIVDLSGRLSAFDSQGARATVPEALNEQVEQGSSATNPIISSWGTVIFAEGAQVVEFAWTAD